MKQKTNWWLDVVLFAAFIITYFMDITGLEVHQWLGIAVLAITAVHLIKHWDWVVAISRRFFGTTTPKARVYALLDAALLAGLGLIVVTGLVISTWFNLSLANASTWIAVHIIISITALLVLAVKLALHWRWLVRMLRKLSGSKHQVGVQNPQLQPVRTSTAQMNRREFVKIGAVVGGASLLALVSATSGLAALDQSTSESFAAVVDNQDSAVPQGRPGDRSFNSSSSTSDSSSSDNSCRVQCNRGCSYPGHCRRYVDSNQNGRCDLGECL